MSRRVPPSKFQSKKCTACGVSAWHKNFFIGVKFSYHLFDEQILCFICKMKTKKNDFHSSAVDDQFDDIDQTQLDDIDQTQPDDPSSMKRFKKSRQSSLEYVPHPNLNNPSSSQDFNTIIREIALGGARSFFDLTRESACNLATILLLYLALFHFHSQKKLSIL